MKILVSVILLFFSCFSLDVFGSGSDPREADSDSDQPNNPDNSENPISSPVEHLEGLVKYFKAAEVRNGEQEKINQDLKEQMKLLQEKNSQELKALSDKFEHLQNRIFHGVWLLTPPLRGPPGPKGDSDSDSGLAKPRVGPRISDPDPPQQLNLTAESCIPEENWVSVHEQNNTSPSDVKTVFNATIGIFFQNSTTAGNSTNDDDNEDSVGSSHAFVHAENFARIGKSESNSTGFDWTSTPFYIWTRKARVNETYTCKAGNSCVLKQLVGHCGNVRVPVNKFSQVSTPIATSISDSQFSSCSAAMEILRSPRSKKQSIYPHENGTKVDVLCDFEVDGGGWTVIQKRTSGPQEEFNRTWTEYANGFGSLGANFWLGLDNIRALTKTGDQELRIELEDFERNKLYAKYSSFSISDSSDFYKLSMSGFSENSTAGESMITYQSGNRFIAKGNGIQNCLSSHGGGGWWFQHYMGGCGWSNLNGSYKQKGEYGVGIWWYNDIMKRIDASTYRHFAKSEMKIRKRK